MLEYLFILAAIFCIAVFFYKQANEQLEILQLDADRIADLPTLLAERSPVILRNYTTPALGTLEEVSKQARLQPLFHRPAESISANDRSVLSQHLGMDLWFEHAWLPALTTYLTRLYTSPRSRMVLRQEGLSKTTAPTTFFMPTQGSFSVFLLVPRCHAFLPPTGGWKGICSNHLTLDLVPLLGQLQWLELKVRKGHVLFLPPHQIVEFREESGVDQTALGSWGPMGYLVELHTPISRLATS